MIALNEGLIMIVRQTGVPLAGERRQISLLARALLALALSLDYWVDQFMDLPESSLWANLFSSHWSTFSWLAEAT